LKLDIGALFAARAARLVPASVQAKQKKAEARSGCRIVSFGDWEIVDNDGEEREEWRAGLTYIYKYDYVTLIVCN